MGSTNIQIAVKVRPLIERELKEKVEPMWLIRENSIVHVDSAKKNLGEPYYFDHIFDESTSNQEVYDATVKPLVISCLKGINSTIFAYGQTSSGKTHTMLGGKDVPGIIMYTIEDIFKHISESASKNFLLRCSYIEIYNEKINDLLDTNTKDLKIREDLDQMVYVQAKEEVIQESDELLSIMKRGMKTRKIGCTDLNERSSRSHTIFKLVIQSQNKDSEGSYTESCLSLVDLAGSERVGQMNIKGERQAEGVSINKSLTTLGLVIRKLSDNELYINYRDSKLTRLLQHSLGGNSKTLIICTVTVAAAEETKSTLEFAQRAKHVQNRPIINKKVTDKDQLKHYANLCQNYKDQIEKLRLERIEKDQTINALEDKISNIQLFTSEQTTKVSKIPQRRHTLGYYKPLDISTFVLGQDDEVIHECDENDVDHPGSPIDTPSTSKDEKNNVILNTDTPSTSKDKKNNVIFDTETPSTSKDEMNNFNFDTDIPSTSKDETPSKGTSQTPDTQQTLDTQQTPSPVVRMQKALLEESYDDLRLFTSYEKQLAEQHDQIKELVELTERLRNENIALQQQNIRSREINLNLSEKITEVSNSLIILRSVLEVKPVEEVRRMSLPTIEEEDITEMLTDQIEPSFCFDLLDNISEIKNLNEELTEKLNKVIEENQLLQQQLIDKENIISTQNASYSKEIDKIEAKYTALATENEKLKTQLESKNIKVNELKTCISQHNDIKEAELEILTNKNKELNDYKEEMHRQLSELHQLNEQLSQGEPGCSYTPQNDLNILRKENNELKQVTKYEAFKIAELEEENQRLTTEVQTTAELKRYLIDQIENKSSEEGDEEITNIRRGFFDLQGEVKEPEIKNNNIEEEYSKELSELKQKLVLRDNKIAELENYQTELTDKFYQYIQESSEMKEKYNTIEQGQVHTEKKIERLTQVEVQYTALINHIREVLGGDLDVPGYVNTLKALKTDNEVMKSKLESNEAITDELKPRIERLKTESHGFSENIDNTSQSEREANGDQTGNTNSVSVKLEAINLQQHEENLDQELQLKNIELTKQVAFLQDQLKEKLLQIKQYDEQVSQLEILEKENNLLKAELEDVVFQLSGEQKEVASISQQLDEKSSIISNLEKKLYESNQQISLSKLHTENIQESLSKKEEHKTLEQICTFSDAEHIKQLEDNRCSKELQQKLEEEIVNLVKHNTEMKEECDTLKNDNSRLRSDFEHVLSQLCEKENYVLNICQQLKDHSSLIGGLEQEILRMKECYSHVEVQEEQFQKTSAELCKKEKEIQILQEQFRLLNEKDAEKINLMQKYIQKLKAQEEELDLKTINLKSLASENLELKTQIEKLSNGYNGPQDSEQEFEENSETKKNSSDSKKRLATHAEEVKTLKEKCLTQEHELKKALKQLNNTLQELARQTELYKNLEAKCAIQDSQLESYKEQLINKMTELDDKSNLYNNILTTYADKNVQIESLEAENEDIKNRFAKIAQYQVEVSDLKESLIIKNNDNEKIRKELRKQLDSNINLQNDLEQNYLQITTLKTQLESKNVELDVRANEISDLRSHIVASELSMEQEIEVLEAKNLFLKQQVDQLSKDKVDISLQLTKISADSKKSEEVKIIEKEDAKLSGKLELALNELLDMKRNLDKRNEEFSHLRGKYNALEVKLDRCQDLLKATNQKLKKQNDTEKLMEISKSGKEALIVQTAELQSKVEYYSSALEEMQNENKLKTDQLRRASEENEMLRRSMKDVEFLQEKFEEYKLNRQKLNDCNQEIIILKDNVCKLTEAKNMLSNSADRMTSVEKVLNPGDQRIIDQNKLKEELQASKALVAALDSQVKLKKNQVDYLTEKLQLRKTEMDNLQEKVNDLVEYKQRVQEKIADGTLKEVPIPRLSDEGRSLSPSDLRRIKRRSIHDQRRGLVVEPSNSRESTDIDCPVCQESATNFNGIFEKNKCLLAEIEDLKKSIENLECENRYLNDKNGELELKNKKLQEKAPTTPEEIIDCSECKELTSKLAKNEDQNNSLKREIDVLKETNCFLDKENEDMLKIIRELEKSENDLHDQLHSKNLPDPLTDNELCKLRIRYDQVFTQKTELEEALRQNKILISEYKKNLLEMEANYKENEYEHEKIVKELQRKLNDYESKPSTTLPTMEDKATQATCDMHEKYTQLKKLAHSRRKENNYLRAQLNMPPDCAVLPEDIHRQPTNL